MRRFIVCCLLLLSTRIFADTKTIFTRIVEDQENKYWLVYDDNNNGIFSLDEALAYTEDGHPHAAMGDRSDYSLDGLEVEDIDSWGFTLIVNKLITEHKWIAVCLDEVGVFEYYNIGGRQMLTAIYKRK